MVILHSHEIQMCQFIQESEYKNPGGSLSKLSRHSPLHRRREHASLDYRANEAKLHGM